MSLLNVIYVNGRDSADSPAPERGYSVRHGHPAGRDVGASARGHAERRHPRLQGQSLISPELCYVSCSAQHVLSAHFYSAM